MIVCKKPNSAEGIPRESFGRPLVTCVRQSDQRDIGQEMVRTGCAAAFRDKGVVKSSYEVDEIEAARLLRAQRSCQPYLQPDIWRRQN